MPGASEAGAQRAVASPGMAIITDTAQWYALLDHRRALGDLDLRQLFAADPARAERLVTEVGDLRIDWSKHIVTRETVRLLVALAEASGLVERRDAMFRGERINTTEDRAVLHVALRAPPGASIEVDGVNVVPAVHEVLGRMAAFSDEVRSGAWRGATGERIRTIVNIGIGGSDLGPAMAYQALRELRDARTDLPVRVERRRRRRAPRAVRPRSGNDDVRDLVEDLLHDRDVDQCPHGAGAG